MANITSPTATTTDPEVRTPRNNPTNQDTPRNNPTNQDVTVSRVIDAAQTALDPRHRTPPRQGPASSSPPPTPCRKTHRRQISQDTIDRLRIDLTTVFGNNP
jgi:hypothetical protein